MMSEPTVDFRPYVVPKPFTLEDARAHNLETPESESVLDRYAFYRRQPSQRRLTQWQSTLKLNTELLSTMKMNKILYEQFRKSLLRIRDHESINSEDVERLATELLGLKDVHAQFSGEVLELQKALVALRREYPRGVSRKFLPRAEQEALTLHAGSTLDQHLTIESDLSNPLRMILMELLSLTESNPKSETEDASV